MSLKEVKGKIRSVKKIHQVTKAMEAVSAVKMRRSQAAAIEARPYALHALGVLRRLVAHGVAQEHELVKRRTQEDNVLLVVITSDRGLAGALNSYVLKKAHALMRDKGWQKEQVSILAIGKKGYEYFTRRGFEVVDHLERWGEGVALGDPDKLGRRLIQKYLDGAYDRVMLVYSNFESTFNQAPVTRRLLPISFAALDDVIDGIVPERGKYSELRDVAKAGNVNEYVYEPSATTVLDELFPYLIGVMLHHSVLEANASEHSARMVAMKSASDRARDITKELTLAFNKERQTSITAEIGEITSGIEAMK
jgi:F-type H+-transporting ATPase subunit gamma